MSVEEEAVINLQSQVASLRNRVKVLSAFHRIKCYFHKYQISFLFAFSRQMPFFFPDCDFLSNFYALKPGIGGWEC